MIGELGSALDGGIVGILRIAARDVEPKRRPAA
jgi:hypothetical protein